MSTLSDLLDGLRAEIDEAMYYQANKGRGGQHVPFHGDFSNVPPSGLNRLAWWERALRGVVSADATKDATLARQALDAFGRLSPFLPTLDDGPVRYAGHAQAADKMRAAMVALNDALKETK